MHPPESAAPSSELSGRTALITGGGRGIGRAIALEFARLGARVAVAARTLPEVQSVAAECGDLGASSLALALDVADPDQCKSVVRDCEAALGPIGILVNNAGNAISSKFIDLDDLTWRRTIDVNLTGPFYMTRAALPGMLSRTHGSVIAVSSVAGRVGAPYISAYSASKHGVIGLMRSLAAEYPRSGVTFNCVCPAYVDTPMTERSIATIVSRTGRTRQQALGALLTPQGRLIEPEEVAALCAFLAGPRGRSINGQAINLDGGMVQS